MITRNGSIKIHWISWILQTATFNLEFQRSMKQQLFLQHKLLHRCFICDKSFGTHIPNPENLKAVPRELDRFSDANTKLMPYHEVIKHLRSGFCKSQIFS